MSGAFSSRTRKQRHHVGGAFDPTGSEAVEAVRLGLGLRAGRGHAHAAHALAAAAAEAAVVAAKAAVAAAKAIHAAALALAHLERPDLNLWYTDDSHSNVYGCYLASCVMVASYFDTSVANVGDDFIDAETAAFLRSIADRVVLDGEVPNW